MCRQSCCAGSLSRKKYACHTFLYAARHAELLYSISYAKIIIHFIILYGIKKSSAQQCFGIKLKNAVLFCVYY